MTNKRFILIGFLVLMFLMPIVFAVDFSIDGIFSWIDSNGRYFSAGLFLLIALPIMWMIVNRGLGKMGFGDDYRNAKIFLAGVLAVGATWAMDVFQSSLLGGYIIPDYSWVIAVLVGVLAIAVAIYSLSGDGETNYELVAFGICAAFIALYHILQKFVDNFPDRFGGWGTFLDVVYVILALALVVITGLFLWNNVISGVRLNPRAPHSDKAMKNIRTNYSQKQEKERLQESEKEAREARKEFRVSRRDVRKLKHEITKAQDILTELRQAVISKNASAIKGVWLSKGRGKLKKLEKLRGVIRAYIGLIYELATEMVALKGIKKKEKTKLETSKNELLKLSCTLGDVINKISAGVQASPVKWGDLATEINNANDTLNKIDGWAKGAIVLEQKMRAELGRE